jgi:hypothetical protein
VIIIFGLRGRQIELASGQFFCPSCDTTRRYKHKRAADYFTLFFIPLFQVRNRGEYIECQTCQKAFKPEVRHYKPPSSVERLLAATRADLESGTPIQMTQRKLINSGVDEETAEKVVELAAGDRRKFCQNCGLSYRETVTLCSSCGNPLNEST